MKLELSMVVYHKDVYNGREPLTVVGIKKDVVELAGDYSGGTNNLSQSDWLSISGVLFKKSEIKPNPLNSLNLENINGFEILEFLEGRITDNNDLCDTNLCTPLELEEQSVGLINHQLTYKLSFTSYFNNWGTHQSIYGNEIHITNSGVYVFVGEAFEGDGSDEELEKILMDWLPTHKFKSKDEIETKFQGMISFCCEALGSLKFSDKETLSKVIEELTEAKTLMK